MNGSELLATRKGWVKHLERCPQCKRVALRTAENRCQEGQELRDEMLRVASERIRKSHKDSTE